ncbi:hypothetical protein [Streptomyces misionensis]|uniref:hypothetical protein n=1 Tax=Streptomyces misionensis TaxID=67331 RepID=UPI00396BB828
MSTRTPSMRAAHNHMQARRRRLKAIGQWEDPYVPAEPVRSHLRAINATGMSFRAIADRVGLPHDSSLQPLMWGRGKWGPAEKVKRETAELVLAYWPTLHDFQDDALIDVTGTQRRVQALAVRGWSRNEIARRIRMREDNFRKAISKDRVTAYLARQVAAVYDELWNQDPVDHGISRNAVARIRANAERSGWHGPLAWDDETLDEPAAVPVTDAVEPIASEGENLAARWLLGESVVLTSEARKEVVAHLFEWTNDTTEEIAEKVGMTPAAAEASWHRMKRQARLEGRRMWRRVYVPRERTLKQNEMEEAA